MTQQWLQDPEFISPVDMDSGTISLPDSSLSSTDQILWEEETLADFGIDTTADQLYGGDNLGGNVEGFDFGLGFQVVPGNQGVDLSNVVSGSAVDSICFDFGPDPFAGDPGFLGLAESSSDWSSDARTQIRSETDFSSASPEFVYIQPLLVPQAASVGYKAPDLAPYPTGNLSTLSAYEPSSQEQKKVRTRKRKNPEDLKRNQNKRLKPAKCTVCNQGHTDKRDLDRHLVSNHRKEAERRGLDVSKVKCETCGQEFDSIRRDRLKKHMKNIHALYLRD